MSAAGEAMAFAYKRKIVYLESKFNYERHENAFDIAWTMELENSNEVITSILCIPLASGSHSTTDWTCIAIGTQSGAVLFYTDSRFLLLTQSWHTEPITDIKAQGGKYHNEEIHVFTSSCVCFIEGHSLFPILRTLRQQYIKCECLLDATSYLT